MDSHQSAKHRFQVGGSISGETSYYIARHADKELYEALIRQELCYVFNSRQMGKSSLLFEIKRRLQAYGKRCVFIDLSRIGSVNVNVQQWYAGIIHELWRGFELPTGKMMLEWWESLGDIPPAQKLSQFLQEHLPTHYPDDELIVFFDEVDSVLSLSFNTDDFFSVIRACFNLRADNQDLTRVTFAFFGVAVPGDLISDERRSPFNIGRAISMEGFTDEEACPFQQGLRVPGKDSSKLLSAILHWSGGQPFLTQKICQLVTYFSAEAPTVLDEEAWINQLILEHIIQNWESKDNPEHIRTIRDRMLLDECFSTNNLSNYGRILASANESLAIEDVGEYRRLYLTGLIAVHNGYASPRTKVYRRVFNEEWLSLQLESRRPYAQNIKAWQSCGDDEWLLSGDELERAVSWSENKHLSEEDHRFIAASREKQQKQVQNWNERLQEEIAQRKLAESELQAALEELQQAKVDAEKANEAKSNFLARVSREVRTPINSVLGLSHLALQREETVSGREYLKKIHRATSYMLGVINDIVDINKLERGELLLSNDTFYVDDVLDNLLDIIIPSLHRKGLEFKLKQTTELLPPLYGDGNRLQQVLLNLASNAFRYTHSGIIEIRVDKLDQTDDYVRLLFGLRDSGCGVSEQEVEGVVCKSEDSIIKPGLGLSLCCELIELMGGKLKVASKPNYGSDFTFTATFNVKNSTDYKEATELFNIALIGVENKQLLHQLELIGHCVSVIQLESACREELERADKILIDAEELEHNSGKLSPLLTAIQGNAALEIHPLLFTFNQKRLDTMLLPLSAAITYPCSTRYLVNMLSKSRRAVSSAVLPKFIIPYKVLVVDDDEINQQIVGELLDQHNLRFVVAENGAEAIEQLVTQTFDLVLMDIEMPVLDGISTVQRIRQMAKDDSRFDYLSELPIIAMTAHALVGDKARFVKLGLDEHLTKPIDPPVFSTVLRKWLPEDLPDPKVNAVSGRDDKEELLSIEPLDGIDVATGVARCGGNHQLYYKLLLEFANSYQHALNLQRSEHDVFASKCHSIKGSAGNLGLTMIAQNASDLERKYQTEGVFTEMEISHFLQLLAIQCQQVIDKYQPHAVNTDCEQKPAVEAKIKILILSDNAERLKPIVKYLAADYKVLVARAPFRAQELLVKHARLGSPVQSMIAFPTGDNEAIFRIADSNRELRVILAGDIKDEAFLEKALASGVSEFLPQCPAPLLVKLRLEQGR
ncbi:AAA-like domain-containing protein [Photobacterium satsumensis]